jgi:hypothetical protein
MTEYFSAGPTLLWDTLLSDSGQGGSFIEAGPFGTYSAGQQSTENWNDYPQHPGADANLLGGSFLDVTGDTLPSATRQGDVLSIIVNPFTDNTPGHFSEGLEPDPPGTTVSGSYQIRQNGTSVASGALTDGPAFAEATLTPDPAAVAVTIKAARTGPAYPLSTRTVTTWTWRTSDTSSPPQAPRSLASRRRCRSTAVLPGSPPPSPDRAPATRRRTPLRPTAS